ncbi:zinc finger protein JACKDAW-like isoform X1 [Syzygium oleosum]|uniref:zinc finger protein JACKDAW-like isoform X1 n=1 Tax=Syzygium oleosum TaxID=219896 RepID=UPI0011D1D4B2|nr:zinc finger protein JACKDAW-like isoform X1 [Syzygium oleosum]XP_030454262.1 zinc finger protein JACKDAW-like isoform X1 [Syzygium oleosum]XP_056169146.1 zinc finger protein JACKDAW-like isoform X1 [Syzygium oleosum]XP_056169148.1 zinc finger protein JACKDAW-like isoform X2 [Syzygium oleosum]XP_056169149.1 zinc finger protein JACKDAW-like isoform X1 [Syzygium oleosum]
MMSGDGLSLPTTIRGFVHQEPNSLTNPNPSSNHCKKKRSLPGTPDPDAEVIALSPKSLMATNRFICEICNKGFQRDQNLQLHRRGHNLPWKLKQRTNKELIRRKVYICPEETCVHHDPSRALGDLTGIKKHYSRKHGEKKWKCEKCSKKYAVQSDWKAHSKICGTREYKCDCGTLFSRKDSFITHRAFCDALTEEGARFTSLANTNLNFGNELINGTMTNNTASAKNSPIPMPDQFDGQRSSSQVQIWMNHVDPNLNPLGLMASSRDSYLTAPGSGSLLPDLVQASQLPIGMLKNYSIPASLEASLIKQEESIKTNMSNQAIGTLYSNNHPSHRASTGHMSATALLQKAAQLGSTRNNNSASFLVNNNTVFGSMSSSSASSSLFSSSLSTASDFNPYTPQTRKSSRMLFRQYPSSKVENSIGQTESQKLHASPDGVENSLTRDFLGVGSENRPFLIHQELSRFSSSVGSSMEEAGEPAEFTRETSLTH